MIPAGLVEEAPLPWHLNPRASAPPVSRVTCLQRVVERYRGLEAGDIASDVRTRKISYARHEAMWITRNTTDHVLMTIGRIFAVDHSSIVHAVRRVDERLGTEPRLRDELTLMAYFAGMAS
jgi:chromosomal replication initiator protein